MTRPGARGPSHVPTLTEVVQVTPPAPATETPAPPSEPASADWSQTVVLPAGEPAVDEGRIIENVLADLQRQIDLMLEYRLREAIGPALARASDALIREVRSDLASAMRELVARAVAQELARHRGR